MKFDALIIGGGLSGLVCGIRMQGRGLRTAIISAGQSALHFFSGSFDLLRGLPADGDENSLKERVGALDAAHPYRKIGAERVVDYARQVPLLLEQCGISTYGTVGANHGRITPLGIWKKAWLTLSDFELPDLKSLRDKSVVIINFAGFLDFYSNFMANAFVKAGIGSWMVEANLPRLDRLRSNPTEMRPTNIAGVFEQAEQLDELLKRFKELPKGEAYFLPAVFGLHSSQALDYLRTNAGLPLYFLPTMPPSVPGIRTQYLLKQHYTALGGTFLMGDVVEKAVMDGTRVEALHTANQGDVPMQADHYVLATGSFFGEGIKATPHSVYESVFGLDVQAGTDRNQWFNPQFAGKQPYMSFGVLTDDCFRPSVHGSTVENLFAIGSILAGCDAGSEGCGGGVAMLSALRVADYIGEGTR